MKQAGSILQMPVYSCHNHSINDEDNSKTKYHSSKDTTKRNYNNSKEVNMLHIHDLGSYLLIFGGVLFFVHLFCNSLEAKDIAVPKFMPFALTGVIFLAFLV
jgi:hypothetical protein